MCDSDPRALIHRCTRCRLAAPDISRAGLGLVRRPGECTGAGCLGTLGNSETCDTWEVVAVSLPSAVLVFVLVAWGWRFLGLRRTSAGQMDREQPASGSASTCGGEKRRWWPGRSRSNATVTVPMTEPRRCPRCRAEIDDPAPRPGRTTSTMVLSALPARGIGGAACGGGGRDRHRALLRVRTDRFWLRSGGRPAGARACQVDDDADHLRPPLALRRGPRPGRVGGSRRGSPRFWRGHREADGPSIASDLGLYTLKRNSTTSPSAIT